MCKTTLLNEFRKRRYVFLLFIVILIGTGLRLYHLGKQSLWLDEAYSVMMSRNLFTLWFEQVKDSSPPLYYSILHYWMGLFGDTEFSLRLLSSILGILLIPLVFIVGTVIFDRRVGIYASLFTAISPIHIYYSQEVKMYSLMPFLSLTSFFMLYLSIKEKKNIYWVVYVLTTIFCLYTHNYGVLLLAAEICFFIFFHTKKYYILPKFILSQICILVAYFPRSLVLSKQIAMDMNPWISVPTLKDLGSTFLHFCLVSWRLPLTESICTTLKIVVPIFAVIFLVGIIKSHKQKSFLPVYFIIPLALAFCISFKLPIYVAGRYDILVFPAFCLIIAVGLNRIAPRFLRLSLLAIIVVSTSISLYHYYFIYKKSNDRLVSRYVQTYVNREDVIVVTELSITPFEYYWIQEFRPELFQFPEVSMAFLMRKALEGEERYVNSEIAKLTSKIYPLLNENNRLWLLYQPMALFEKLLERLRRDFENTGDINFSPGDNLNQIRKVYIFKKRQTN